MTDAAAVRARMDGEWWTRRRIVSPDPLAGFYLLTPDDADLLTAQETQIIAITAERDNLWTEAGEKLSAEMRKRLDAEIRAGQAEAERDEALKAEGQKDEWLEMLSQSLRNVVLAAMADDSWEGTVAEGLDILNGKFAEMNAAVAERDRLREALKELRERTSANGDMADRAVHDFVAALQPAEEEK